MDPLKSYQDAQQTRTVVRVHKSSDIPKGAKFLTNNEVLEHHMRKIRNWDNKKEVWALRYGTILVSATSALGGWLANAHYRQKFKLRAHGRVASYLPAVCLPAMTAALFHQVLVTNKILTDRTDCSVCMETRSGAISASLGGVYPLLIAPISCVILARKYYTMSVPKISEGGKVLSLFQKTSPMFAKVILLLAGQFFFGMFIAEREMMHFHKHIGVNIEDIGQKNEGFY